MNRFLAIDPGKDKCGLVLVDFEEGIVLAGRVVSSELVIDVIKDWQNEGTFKAIFLGNGTSSEYWNKKLIEFGSISVVEERGTTLRARKRYWELWPPINWRKFLPRGLNIPPVDLDAIAALVLLEDHLQTRFNWPGPPGFKILP